ncbi:Bug family tripartite tricarboxylate transporter substrate binding protein [Brevibacterium yomogidense]|uniref:Bug family tripartite tricarboxylate transporter substrate binding protein n=1 Tax=Brevibacterium yomogidense TaxID=946573 RepID=UPI0018DF4F3B|nr:tripartite tricarboxylate transporter substrate binding protein [Brevibacterium yomogidense]
MKKSMKTISGLAAVGALTLAGCGGGGDAEGYSASGNVTMIVPFAAGGGSDIAGRATAAGLEDATGRTITVQNIDGGSGAVGYSEFLGRNGDGNYLLATETAMVALPLTQDVEFTYEDFTPIMKLAEDFTIIAAAGDSDLESCSDLVEQAKSERTVVAIAGATGLDNITFSLMEDQTGAEFDRVPFESGSEVLTALMGGQVEAVSVNPSEVSGQIESGDVKPLCAASEERYDYEGFEDVETAAEQGIDVAFAQFRGFIAPGGISDEARDYWIEQAQAYAETDEFAAYIEDNLLQPTVEYGDDFTAYLAENEQEIREALDL